SDVLKALTIRRWIEQNMIYSLEADHKEDDDPVGAFLFGDHRGYCVHVAHAMTYLLRSVGIPARVAGGYAVDAGRPGRGAGILLQSTDMHAWCEVYFEGIGWQVVDAALERSESPSTPSADVAVQQFYNERNREPVPAPGEQAGKKDVAALSPGMCVLMVLSLILAIYAVKVWRTVIPRFARENQLHRVCYRAAADRLAEIGLLRQYGETRDEFARRSSALAPAFALLTKAHVLQAVTGDNCCDRQEWLA